jgi:NTE family protein
VNLESIDTGTRLRKLARSVAAVACALFLAGPGPPAFAAGAPAEPTADTCLALGAGGANGLAHVAVLETLDELGVRPRRIAGSSIGAIVGALYASGLSGREIRDLVMRSFTVREDQPLSDLLSEDAVRWAELIEVDLGDGGLLSSDGIMAFLIDALEVERFEALELPLLVVAGDLWTREQVVLREGDLASALRASMALPGVFRAVRREGRTLVDGGTVNPVPFDLLSGDCGFVIAVDVAGVRTPPENGAVGYFETVFNAAKVMQQSIVNAKRQLGEPDLYLAPAITDIRSLEFHRAEEVFEQARPVQERLRRELPDLLGLEEPPNRPR